jgi:hypothetical protein
MFRRLLAALLILLFAASFALGQGKKKKEPQEKSVNGIVTDANDKPVPGAVVQLKNMRTLEVRSFIAGDMGDYFFHGLATDVDYELKAESNGKSSPTRLLSSFDSHPNPTINLKLK